MSFIPARNTVENAKRAQRRLRYEEAHRGELWIQYLALRYRSGQLTADDMTTDERAAVCVWLVDHDPRKTMKRTLTTAALLLLMCAGVASAQTHPCDIDPGTTFTVNAGTVTVAACWSEQDLSGAPAVATQWGLTVDGLRSPITMSKATPTANAAGFFQFTGSVVLPKGTHTGVLLDVCIDDGIGGTACKSIDTALTVKAKGPGPKAPTRGKAS